MMGTITRNMLCMGFLNINGIAASLQDPKNKQILQLINSSELDIIGLAETN
jgi:Ni,Fe-hydrogenase III large subunit